MIKLVFSLSSLSAVGYIIGFINQIVIATKWGTSNELEIYLIAFSCINFAMFFLGPFNEVAVHWFFSEFKNNIDEGIENFSKSVNLLLIINVLIMVLIYLSRDYLYSFSIQNEEINQVSFNEQIVSLLIVIPLLTFTQYFQFILNSLNRFIAQSMNKIVTSAVALLFLLLFSDSIGTKAIIYGMEFGLFIQFIIQYMLILKTGCKYKPTIKVISSGYFYKALFIMILTYFVSSLQVMYERMVYLGFGEGYLSSFNYANSLLQIPYIIFISSLVAIFATRMMEYLHNDNKDRGLDEILHLIIYLNSGLVFISIFLSVYSKDIIFLLFKRGSFDAVSVETTSYIFNHIILSMPFLIVGYLLGKPFVILKQTKKLMKVAVSGSIIYVLLIYFSKLFNEINIIVLAPLIVQVFISVFMIYYYVQFYSYKKTINFFIFFHFILFIVAVLFFIALEYFYLNFLDDTAFKQIIKLHYLQWL
ncbi:lipid II flippase MurJ [Vibrio sp. PP-XX7]